jgi:hypothetical protein
MKRWWKPAALLLVAACKDRETPAVADTVVKADTAQRWVLDATSLGPFRTGITLAQFNAQLGERLVPSYEISTTCDHVDPASFPEGVIVMIENDSVARFDVENPAIRTREGVGVGDLENDVVRLYGSSITVSPHAYTGPDGHYLTVTPAGDTLHRIIFETDGQKVLHIRAGKRPAVDYIEGCA